jgi:hypothetical protein
MGQLLVLFVMLGGITFLVELLTRRAGLLLRFVLQFNSLHNYLSFCKCLNSQELHLLVDVLVYSTLALEYKICFVFFEEQMGYEGIELICLFISYLFMVGTVDDRA